MLKEIQGDFQMKRDELRQKLIDGTIQVIARDGFDKATTKQVGTVTHINEAYIYRCFQGKEDMYIKMFDMLDAELENVIMQNMDIMYISTIDIEMRARVFFFKVWNFLLGNKEKCLAYVRYYYSPYFGTYSVEAHRERFKSVVEKFKPVFIDEANVWLIMNHILNVMLDFAIKVHNNQMPSNDNYAEHVFRVTYRSVEQYCKKEEVKNNE